VSLFKLGIGGLSTENRAILLILTKVNMAAGTPSVVAEKELQKRCMADRRPMRVIVEELRRDAASGAWPAMADLPPAPMDPLPFQVDLADEYLWFLVACQLKHKTKWKKLEPVLATLRCFAPYWETLDGASSDDLEQILQPLGKARHRATQLLDLASLFPKFSAIVSRVGVEDARAAVLALPGCGDYVADSWDLFVAEKDPDEISPTDPTLLEYMELQKKGHGPCLRDIDATAGCLACWVDTWK